MTVGVLTFSMSAAAGIIVASALAGLIPAVVLYLIRRADRWRAKRIGR